MITMYEVMKNAISRGGYKLMEVQQRIKRLYALGDLTEEQMEELLQLAAEGASADAERPSDVEMIMSLAEMVAALEARVEALEGANDNGGSDDSGEEEQPEYEVWKPWDGISNDYQYGAIVSHNDNLWISVFTGQNVWEPGVVGTEALWQLYTSDSEACSPLESPAPDPAAQKNSRKFRDDIQILGRVPPIWRPSLMGNVRLPPIWRPNRHEYFPILPNRFYLLRMAKTTKKDCQS